MADSIGLMGGTIVDPEASLHGPGDVLIEDGIILAVGEGVASRAETTIDCRGTFVLPGLIDSHTHTFAGRPISARRFAKAVSSEGC